MNTVVKSIAKKQMVIKEDNKRVEIKKREGKILVKSNRKNLMKNGGIKSRRSKNRQRMKKETRKRMGEQRRDSWDLSLVICGR